MFLPDPRPPLISCLMVTAAGRFDHFRRSVRSYLDQTYPRRELVVVNEGPRAYQDQIAAHLAGRPDVRLVFLDGTYTLGALRNIAVALCHGEVFVQWDDDDFNAPERVAVQYAHLRGHPAARACFLTDQLHYHFADARLYWDDWAAFHSGGRPEYMLVPGTVMARTAGFPARYPSAGGNSRTGEDSVLARALLDEGPVAFLAGQGHLHVYSYHGRNVWDAAHHEKISRDRALPVADLLRRRDRIRATLDYLGLPARVTGRDGLAFVHGGGA